MLRFDPKFTKKSGYNGIIRGSGCSESATNRHGWMGPGMPLQKDY